MATSVGQGDTHIIAYYDNGVAAIPVIRRYGPVSSTQNAAIAQPTTGPDNDSHGAVDRLVNAKLDKLGLVPSLLCSDAEFLRRVSIDMTGNASGTEEVTAFLDDKSTDKRDRKVDELLERSTYAAWWANKLCDFTGCNPKSISSLLEVAREDGYVKASEWYDWIYQRVEKNEPYDRLVAGIMLSDLTGRKTGCPTSGLGRVSRSRRIQRCPSLMRSWGSNCNARECHKHPFDVWTQADFGDFSRFFDSVTRTKRRPEAQKKQDLRLLRSQVVTLELGDDPRRPDHGLDARPEEPVVRARLRKPSLGGILQRGNSRSAGSIHPRESAEQPAIARLAHTGLHRNGYDMKWLHRQITTSDAYQRSWKPNDTNRHDRRNFSRAIPRRIPAEVVYDAMKQATAATEQQATVRTIFAAARRAISP